MAQVNSNNTASIGFEQQIWKENKRLKDILPKKYVRNELDKRCLGNVRGAIGYEV